MNTQVVDTRSTYNGLSHTDTHFAYAFNVYSTWISCSTCIRHGFRVQHVFDMDSLNMCSLDDMYSKTMRHTHAAQRFSMQAENKAYQQWPGR